MRLRILFLVLPGCALACTAVDGDRIAGSDLARADARFAALAADLTVGFPALPGRQRTLEVPFLSTLAGRHGISAEGLAPLCFERPTELLSEARLRPVLERALGAGTKVEIVEFSEYAVPKGELEFSFADLVRPSSAAGNRTVIWRGRIRYGPHSSVPVWAKVRVLRFETWLEAAKAIPARKPIEPEQIVKKSGWRFPFATPALADPAAVRGKQASRSLAPGQLIVPALLVAANEIERGDAVDVEVASGGVSLRFAGRAETGGHRGEILVVTAADTGKRHRARIEEKGKVVISADITSKPLAGNRVAPVAARGAGQGQEDEAARAAILAGSLPR